MKNLREEENMFFANGICSSYFWLSEYNEKIALHVDIKVSEIIVDALNV
jgi:hypothetical protein